MTQPTGRDIDVALAKALGWTEFADEGDCNHGFWQTLDHKVTWLPAFSESLDALLRDVVPECQRRGFAWTMGEGLIQNHAEVWKVDGLTFFGDADTPAEALALACLAALEAKP